MNPHLLFLKLVQGRKTVHHRHFHVENDDVRIQFLSEFDTIHSGLTGGDDENLGIFLDLIGDDVSH